MPYNDRGFRPGQQPAPPPGVQGPIPLAPPGRVGIKPPTAPTVFAPTSATSAPNAPAGDGQGGDPIKAPAAFAPPNAAALNADFDKQCFGPHTTEAQVGGARGQRNANAAFGNLAPTPGVSGGIPAQPEAAWQTKAKGSPAGSPEWRQQFWNYDAKTGQHTFQHSAEAQARDGLGIGIQGTPPRDQAREAIAEQLKYHQDMARMANDRGGSINGNDGAAWGAGVLRYAGALQAHDASAAGVRQGDAIGNLKSLVGMDPASRAIYLASKGVDATTIASLPQPQVLGQSQFNAMNYPAAAAANPETRDAGSVLDNQNLDFHQKAALFAGMPGVERSASPTRQLWDAFMARNQARGHEFDQEMGQYNPQDPTGAKVYDTSNPVAALGSIFGAAKEGIFGVDPAIPARNRALQGHMRTLGYGPASIGVPLDANAARTQIGVKPADY